MKMNLVRYYFIFRLLVGNFDSNLIILDDSADISLRRSTVNTYISILLSSSKTNILQYPDVFIQIMSWILGEYGYLADKMSVEAILEKVCQLILKKDSSTIGDLEMR